MRPCAGFCAPIWRRQSRSLKFVGDLYSPLMTWAQLAVEVVEDMSGREWGFFPRRVLVSSSSPSRWIVSWQISKKIPRQEQCKPELKVLDLFRSLQFASKPAQIIGLHWIECDGQRDDVIALVAFEVA